jgi:hypothetical protein
MTRRSTRARKPTETDQDSGTFDVPTHWTPAQATAVFEVLDDLLESVWRRYGVQIQKVQRRDRSVTTSAIAANLGERDVPF